jgi:hypothetical protein
MIDPFLDDRVDNRNRHVDRHSVNASLQEKRTILYNAKVRNEMKTFCAIPGHRIKEAAPTMEGSRL